MSEILRAVRTRLTGASAVTAIAATRIHWQRLPQAETLPAVVLKEISNEAVEHLLGTSGLSTTRVQVDCYATSYPVAHQLREAVRQRLHAWRGTSEGVSVRSSIQGSRFGTFLDPREGSDDGRHVLVIDFLMTHSETAVSS